jgi:hypothetical protein
MHPLVSGLFHDRFLQVTVLLSAVGALCLIDLLSYIFAPPGFFGLWALRLTAVGAVIGAIGTGVLLVRRQRQIRAIEAALPAFVCQRTAELRQAVELDSSFLTACTACCHFDEEARSCALHIYDRVMKVNLVPGARQSYCLYWNVAGYPELMRTVRMPGD